MIDDTGPVCVDYRVRDGLHRLLDSDFQANRESVRGQWRSAFFDLESLVDHFEVRLEDVVNNTVLAGPLRVGKSTSVTFENLWLNHTQRVRTVVTAVNRAGATTECATDSMLIDLTGPVPVGTTGNTTVKDVVRDGNSALHGWEGEDLEYTHATQAAFASWKEFTDPESGMNNFWVWAESADGVLLSRRVWVHPRLSEWTLAIPRQSHGSEYRVVMRAVNRAKSQKDYRSNGIGVDLTPPFFSSPVTFSVPPEAQGLLPHVVSTETARLVIQASAADPESGLRRCRFALGTYPDGSDLSGVVSIDVSDMSNATRNDETRVRGGNTICGDDDATCVDIPETNHTVTTELTLNEVMNKDFPLLNHFTLYAWVVCINEYVAIAVVVP